MTALAHDPQWQAFLAAIRANLADDTVRLVAADWLDEIAASVECERCEGGKYATALDHRTGQYVDCKHCTGGRVSNGFAEYAELIRIQCEIARLDLLYADRSRNCRCDGGNNLCQACCDERDWNREGKPLLKPEGELGANIPRWLGALGRFPAFYSQVKGYGWQLDNAAIYAEFRRGFIDVIRCRMDQWVAHGPKIVRLPTAAVRKVVVTDRSPNPHYPDVDFDRLGDQDGVYWQNHAFQNDTRMGPLTVGSQLILVNELFSRLKGWRTESDTPWNYIYDSADLAHAALSDACLSLAWASEPAVTV